ncbi:uncharacterized protein BDV17DRAFT_230966 [Aspergillus undulatus]|uniref:uncharacterized protein n=1 Tax=Aspergillus undulatus TaxID=1810928 RepID=UPI003CCD54AD
MSQPTDEPKRPRRFLPEPIETSARSSKQHQVNEPAKQHLHQAHAGPCLSGLDLSSSLEEPIGFSHSFQSCEIGQQPGLKRENNAPKHTYTDSPARDMGGIQHRNTRRFTPQLMETARHSFRPKEEEPVNQDSMARHQRQRLTSADNTSGPIDMDPKVTQESRFSYSSLLRRQETRRHSFRVPDLPAIPSSGSEDSNEPNHTQLPASLSATGQGRRPTSNDRNLLDGQDQTLLEYILPFPLHPSENQLRERALEAFPNEQVYQPVDHFAIDREEEYPDDESSGVRGSRPGLGINRRASSADLPSELEYLRRHKEEAGMNRRHYLTTKGGRVSHVARRTSKTVENAAVCDEVWDTNRRFTQLKQAVSPPMLGGDLAFPQSLTPQSTICESTRAADSNQNEYVLSSLTGLWSGSPRSSAHDERGGLWKGTCKSDRRSTYRSEALLPGLITPRHNVEEDACSNSDESLETRAPRPQNSRFPILSSRGESAHGGYTDQEFGDGFVTQIYDYLSLGYPSIARYYDYELSKVSGLPVAALRADDLNMDAKGHVGVHISTSRGATNNVCMRWTALRLYIQEWVRQQPRMLEVDRYHDGWGVRERKGSWAF